MSSNLIADLTQVNLIKQSIKNAIINKGQTVTNFLSYPGAIENIQSGGDGDIALYENISEMQANTANEGDLALVYNTNNLQALWQYTNNSWELAPVGLTANKEYVNSAKFWGANGVETGTLQVNNNLTADQVKIKAQVFNDLSYLELNSSITSLVSTFYNSTNLIAVPNFNTSNIVSMYNMFAYCGNLTTVPNFNTSKVINMQGMFSSCNNLVEVPNFDTSNVTDISKALSDCYNLTTVPNFNTSKVTNMAWMVCGCNNLTTVPNFDTSNVINMYAMFSSCYNLITVPNFDTSNVKRTSQMFFGCTKLEEVPVINMSNVSFVSWMFIGCSNLSDNSIANITNMLPNANQLSNQYIADIGLNLARFDDDQLRILNNKGYIDAII